MSDLRRLQPFVLIASTAVLSWLGMLGVHELGHVLGAWSTGGTVERVVLHPLTISRTDLSANPRPLFVAWSGPIVGVLVPVLVWVAAQAAQLRQTYLLRFFAGFCLVANGAYIGGGSFGRIGDCGDLLRHGAALWQLWLFGVVAIVTGLGLWNGLGPHFGLGEANGRVDQTATWVCGICAVLVVVTLLLVN